MERDGWQWIEPIKKAPVLDPVIRQDPFVAKPRKWHGYSLVPRPAVFPSREGLLAAVEKREKIGEDDLTRLDPSEYTFVMHAESDSHPLQRWNERVGPVMEGPALTSLLHHLFFLGRMRFHPVGWGWIDQEIVFGYKVEENRRIVLQTFFGRISLKPVLRYYQDLLHFWRKQGDFLDLTVNPATIRCQVAPAVPMSVSRFNGDKNAYHLEAYRYQRDKTIATLYYLQQKGQGRTQRLWIDPTRP